MTEWNVLGLVPPGDALWHTPSFAVLSRALVLLRRLNLFDVAFDIRISDLRNVFPTEEVSCDSIDSVLGYGFVAENRTEKMA